MWLGPDATIHVMRGLDDEVEHEVAAVSRDAARRSLHPPGPDSGARACPICGLTMGRLPVARVMVDSCPTHGTWFDREEVGRVVSACRRLRAAQDPGSFGAIAGRAMELTEDALLVTQRFLETLVSAVETVLERRPPR
ncbi:MAG: hypothetical protein JWP97_604 [Labilithrix sp.]|nr:hypothetical protein [Labilithrix sp.]